MYTYINTDIQLKPDWYRSIKECGFLALDNILYVLCIIYVSADCLNQQHACHGLRDPSLPPCLRVQAHKELTCLGRMFLTSCWRCWTSMYIFTAQVLLHMWMGTAKKQYERLQKFLEPFKRFPLGIFFFFFLYFLRSAFHTVQPIELLNFSEGATVNSPSNTIQISMDCITMHDSDDHLAVSVPLTYSALLALSVVRFSMQRAF